MEAVRKFLGLQSQKMDGQMQPEGKTSMNWEEVKAITRDLLRTRACPVDSARHSLVEERLPSNASCQHEQGCSRPEDVPGCFYIYYNLFACTRTARSLGIESLKCGTLGPSCPEDDDSYLTHPEIQ